MSKFDYDTFKNDDSWAGDFARFSDDFETVLKAMIGGDKYYEPGELLYEESEEPIKRLVFEVRQLLGEYHSEHMRDPRAHDLVQAHDVLLGAVLLERHMWEAMLEGRREDLDDVVARLPGLLDTLDGPSGETVMETRNCNEKAPQELTEELRRLLAHVEGGFQCPCCGTKMEATSATTYACPAPECGRRCFLE